LKNNSDTRVSLIQKAVCEKDGKISFMSFDLNKYDNMGASSIYEIDFTSNRPVYDPDYGRKDVQKTVEVDACRLDTLCNEQKEIKREDVIPDAIFMDVQEAELDVLNGELNELSGHLTTATNQKNTLTTIISEITTHETNISLLET
jgi:FkbM family methyltransferase